MNDPSYTKSFDMPQRGRPKKQYRESENIMQNPNFLLHNVNLNEHETIKESTKIYDEVNTVENEMKNKFDEKNFVKNEIKHSTGINNNVENRGGVLEDIFNLSRQKDTNYNKSHHEYYNNCNEIFDYEGSTYSKNEDEMHIPIGQNYPYKDKNVYSKQEEKEYLNGVFKKMNYESDFTSKNEQKNPDFFINPEQLGMRGNERSNNIFCSEQLGIRANGGSNNIFSSEQSLMFGNGSSNNAFCNEQADVIGKASNNMFCLDNFEMRPKTQNGRPNNMFYPENSEIRPKTQNSGSNNIFYSDHSEMRPKTQNSGSDNIFYSDHSEMRPKTQNSGSNNVFYSDNSEMRPKTQNSGLDNVFYSDHSEIRPKTQNSGSNNVFYSDNSEMRPKTQNSGSNNVFHSSGHNCFNTGEMGQEEHKMGKRMFQILKQDEYTTDMQNKLLENTLFTPTYTTERKYSSIDNADICNDVNLYGRIENDYTGYSGMRKPRYTDFEYQGRSQENNKNKYMSSQHGPDMFYHEGYKNHNRMRQNITGFNNEYGSMDYTSTMNYLYRQPQDYRSSGIISGFRKKRKSSSCMLNATNTKNYKFNIPPSRYSSLEYIKGMENREILNNNVQQPIKEKGKNNSLLGAIVESTHPLSHEHQAILESYKNDITSLDLENITVFQLKSLMKEYGLNTVGKKNELIKILKDTLKKAEDANNRKEIKPTTTKEESKDDGALYDNFFF